MAGTIEYNRDNVTIATIYRATSGGTSFSSNLSGSTTMDYFSDSAVVDDAIYFSRLASYSWSNLIFDVGTTLSATSITVKWEYYKKGVGWTDMEGLTDNTNAFQNAGVNTVEFPMQEDWYKTTVNGTNAIWCRVRITAVSGITEGGANQNTAVYGKDGLLRISGYTEASPCDWEDDLYPWVQSNAPQIGIEKTGTHSYVMTKSNLTMDSNSYFKFENITLEIGTYYSYQRLYWYNCTVTNSTIFLYPTGSGYSYYFRGTWNGQSSVFGWTSYAVRMDAGGTFTDCSFRYVEGIGSTPSSSFYGLGGSATYKRCRLAYILQLLSMTNLNFENTAVYEGNWMSTYNGSLTAYTLDFSDAGKMRIYRTTASPTWIFINPTGLGDYPMECFVLTTTNLSKCWFYDDSAGTYTDYTTEANNDTVGDVPVSGDVGDIIYFGTTYTNAHYNDTGYWCRWYF